MSQQIGRAIKLKTNRRLHVLYGVQVDQDYILSNLIINEFYDI